MREVRSIPSHFYVVDSQLAFHLLDISETSQVLLLLQVADETMSLDIRDGSFSLAGRHPEVQLASFDFRRHNDILVVRFRFVRLVLATELVRFGHGEGSEAEGTDVGGVEGKQSCILIVVEIENALLVGDYLFVRPLQLGMIVLDSLSDQLVQKVVLFFEKGPLLGSRQSQSHLSRYSHLLSLLRLNPSQGQSSILHPELQMFQLPDLLVELLVAEQKSLRILGDSFETIGQVITAIDNLLVIFDLGLPADELLIHQSLDSLRDSFKLEIDVLFDDSAVGQEHFLQPHQLRDLRTDPLSQGCDLFLSVGQVEAPPEFGCVGQRGEFVSRICVRTEIRAGLADCVSARIAVEGEDALRVQSAKPIRCSHTVILLQSVPPAEQLHFTNGVSSVRSLIYACQDILRELDIINWGTMRLTKFLGKVGMNMANKYGFGSRIPSFSALDGTSGDWIKIVHTNDAKTHLPEHKVKDFLEKKSVTSVAVEGSGESAREVSSSFYSESSWRKLKDISKNVSIDFSNQIRQSSNFLGLASEILAASYKFSRKEKDEKSLEIKVGDIPERDYVLQLANAKIQAAEWANSRGNEANTAYLLAQAQKIAAQYPQAKLKVIKGKNLLDDGFGLHHAVGRASDSEPMLVCLEWTAVAESQDYVALVGKGLCFDSGGLNLKPTGGISGMHIDKHGACSILSAFESVAKLNLKCNVVAVLGLAENFVSSNSYRPLDIIRSRKGLTVEIGNTDAEGRLVLADCMNWVQTNYKVKTLVELSTLTGAIVVALGKQRAGVFTNSQQLANEIGEVGKQIEEWTWHMPVDEYHEELVKPKTADLTNSSGKPDGSSCQAAAFLKHFVEPGVEWAHIDIAGAAGMDGATGYGAKLLVHFLKNRVK